MHDALNSHPMGSQLVENISVSSLDVHPNFNCHLTRAFSRSRSVAFQPSTQIRSRPCIHRRLRVVTAWQPKANRDESPSSSFLNGIYYLACFPSVRCRRRGQSRKHRGCASTTQSVVRVGPTVRTCWNETVCFPGAYYNQLSTNRHLY